MPCGFESTLSEFENAQFSLSVSANDDDWATFDQESLGGDILQNNLTTASTTTSTTTTSTTAESSKAVAVVAGDSKSSSESSTSSFPDIFVKVSPGPSSSSSIDKSTFQSRMSSLSISSTSSSIFGYSRRPSMFTAKYRLREERKKILKMSMAKVRRIEDPESFLSRSVLINNTIKRLQREVRDEKMSRHGGYSKFSVSSYRKSFACSRLADLTADDEPLASCTPQRTSHRLLSRKRSLSSSLGGVGEGCDPEDECDASDLLSQIYIPPTPMGSSKNPDCDSEIEALRPKKSRLSEPSKAETETSLLLVGSPLDGDDEGDEVDVVGDIEDWPKPPSPQLPQLSLSPLTLQSSQESISLSPRSAEDRLNEFSLPDIDIEEMDHQDSDDLIDDHDKMPSSTQLITISEQQQQQHQQQHEPENLSSSISSQQLQLQENEALAATTTSTTIPDLPDLDQVDLQGSNESTLQSLQPPNENEEQQASPDSSSSSSDSKENNCNHHMVENLVENVPSCSCACSCVTSSTSNSTSTTPTIIASNNDNSISSSKHHSNCSNFNNLNNNNCCTSSTEGSTGGIGLGSESSTDSQDTKFSSSCGHSSIFGEIQSVVFHNLIASLES